MEIPDVRYLRTERGTIAYQQFGRGEHTIVWTAPPHISIETRWSRPGDLVRWEALGSVASVVIFDYRGLGSSERLPVDRVGQADELCFDLDAVITQVAPSSATLVSTGWATRITVPYVVDNPDAVERLVLLNPVAHNPVQDITSIDEVLELWGTGQLLGRGANIELAPSQRWQAGHNERIVGTPEVVAALMRSSFHVDVTRLLHEVALPTLVIHTGDVAAITPQDSEAVAERIPRARFLLRPSAFFNWGEWGRDIEEFITGVRPASAAARDLAAVMFSDIVASTTTAADRGDALWRDTLGRLDGMVVSVADQYKGRIVKQTGDGHLLQFVRPGDAIAAACRLLDDARMLGVELRTGVHFGEVEHRDDGDLGGIAVHLAARIAAEAGPNQLLVSRTIAELTLGDGRSYTSHGTPPLKGIPGKWELFSLNR